MWSVMCNHILAAGKPLFIPRLYYLAAYLASVYMCGKETKGSRKEGDSLIQEGVCEVTMQYMS